MTVSGVNSSTNPYLNNVQTGFQQQIQDFKALASALQSGDLSAAQTAFAAFQKDIQGNSQSPQAAALSDSNSQLGKDFQALQSALQSGDLSSAQQAFATLQQDLKTTHHHHHHHHSGGIDPDKTAQSTSSTATSTATVGTILDQQA